MIPCRGWPSLAVLIAGLVFIGLDGILAQTTSVTCLSSYNWMDNSKGQNPCFVGAYLQGVCNSGPFNVGALSPGEAYIGPYADQVNECQCSSVTYSTLSACGACQNDTYISWSEWSYNCTSNDIQVGFFSQNIPSGTAVPQWAFQDVTISDYFNVTLAESVGDSPESTAILTATATPASSSIVSAPSSSSPSASTSPPAPTSTSSNKSSDAGAIAGGVVGGVAGVALIAGAAIFFFVKKKRSRMPPSAQYVAAASPPNSSTAPLFPQMAQPRLYDPSDPSTFPVTPPPLTYPSSSVTSYPVASLVQPHYNHYNSSVAEV